MFATSIHRVTRVGNVVLAPLGDDTERKEYDGPGWISIVVNSEGDAWQAGQTIPYTTSTDVTFFTHHKQTFLKDLYIRIGKVLNETSND